MSQQNTRHELSYYYITLRAKLSGAVYCNRSCLWVCVFVAGGVCEWVMHVIGHEDLRNGYAKLDCSHASVGARIVG